MPKGRIRHILIGVAVLAMLLFAFEPNQRFDPTRHDLAKPPKLAESTGPALAEKRLQRPSRYSTDDKFVPDELLVQFRETADPQDQLTVLGKLAAVELKRFSSLPNVVLIQLPAGLSAEEARSELALEPDVESTELNVIYRAAQIPDDPKYSSSWWLDNNGGNGPPDIDINAPEAWRQGTGSRDVVIGLIDSGIDIYNFELQPNLWTNPGEIPNNNIDDDLNGWVDDVYGINATSLSSDITDVVGHATHIAGIMGAKGNNAREGTGIMWDVSIATCKFLDNNLTGPLDGAISCIDYFTDLKIAGINVVATNNSWGSYQRSELLKDAISRQQQQDILFVAAAGNEQVDNDGFGLYPASYNNDNIIAVAAMDRYGALAPFSNYGALSVDIAAPGVDIESTYLQNRRRSFSGTSMAAPMVTGVAGLLKANNPFLSSGEIRSEILSGGIVETQLAGLVASGSRLRADIALPDTDGDGMSDTWEQRFGLDRLNPLDAAADFDGDGLSNLGEFQAVSNPTVRDTDGDGLSDGDEVLVLDTDPTRVDTDGDGLSDRYEVQDSQTDPTRSDSDSDGLDDRFEIEVSQTDPRRADSDNDGMPDGWELDNGLDPLDGSDAAPDSDGDGLSNFAEFGVGTSPQRNDTDSDGLSDGEELNTTFTDPANSDSDGDGPTDGWELDNGFDPLDSSDGAADTDGDGVTNQEEFSSGTNPNDPDSVLALRPWSGLQGDPGRSQFMDVSGVGTQFKILWQQPSSHRVSNVAPIFEGHFFVVDETSYPEQLLAISLATGVEAWRRDLPELFGIAEPIIVDERLVVVGSGPGLPEGFGVVNPSDGAFVNRVESPNDLGLFREHLGLKDQLLLEYEDVRVLIDPNDGSEFWRLEIPWDFQETVMSSEFLFVRNERSVDLYSLDDGTFSKSIDAGACPTSDGQLEVAAALEDSLVVIVGRCLKLISVSTGDVDWTYSSQLFLNRNVVVTDDVVIVTSDVGIYAIDKNTGATLWEWDGPVQGAAPKSIVATNSHVFATTDDNGTYGIDLQSGDVSWSTPASGPLALSPTGILLIKDRDTESWLAIDVSGDSDLDGLSDLWERTYQTPITDPSNITQDIDSDGWTSLQEYFYGTNPRLSDTDGDRISDSAEVDLYATDPTQADTDGDGISDGVEVFDFSTSPLSVDSDSDGIDDDLEIEKFNTSPLDPLSRPTDVRYEFQSFEFGVPSNWRVSPTASVNWSSVESDATDGRRVLRNDDLNDFGWTRIEWTDNFVAGELSYDVRLSDGEVILLIDGEPVFDTHISAESFIDSIQQAKWQRVRIYIPPGEHTLSLQYRGGNRTQDRKVEIDKLRFKAWDPFGSTIDRTFVREGTRVYEYNAALERSGISFPAPIDSRALALAETADGELAFGVYGGIAFAKPATTKKNYRVLSGFTELRLAAVGAFLGVLAPRSEHGIYVLDASGRLTRVVNRGTFYVDIDAGLDGWLYALGNNGDIDRIDINTGETLSTISLGLSADSIAVGRDGEIYSLESHELRSHNADGSIRSVIALREPRGSYSEIAVASDGSILLGTDIFASQVFTRLSSDLVENGPVSIMHANSMAFAPARRAYTDFDADGLPDWWERSHGLAWQSAADATSDFDADGLTALEEYAAGSHPQMVDSDGDGLSDFDEIKVYNTHPKNFDSDDDGLSDGDEIVDWLTNANSLDSDADGLTDREEVLVYLLDPIDSDSDDDNMPDGWEVDNELNALDSADASLDGDADGLDNAAEYTAGTDINSADTDNDGLTDGDETLIHNTSPVNADSDGDSMPDGWEVVNSLLPGDSNDGRVDTDGDSFLNFEEYFSISDPQDSNDRPAFKVWSNFLGSGSRNAYVPIRNLQDILSVRWSVIALDGDAGRISASTTNGSMTWVVVESQAGESVVEAYSALNGDLMWRTALADVRFARQPTISQGRLFVHATGVDYTSIMFVLNPENGEILNQTNESREVLTEVPPLAFGGNAFTSADTSFGRGIARFSGVDGEIDWLSSLVRTPRDVYLAVHDGVLFQANLRGLTRINPDTGEELGVIEMEKRFGEPDSHPVISPRGIALVLYKRALVKFDLNTNSEEWAIGLPLSSYYAYEPVLANGRVYVPGFWFIDVFNEETGTLEARWNAPEIIQSPIIVTPQYLIVPLADSTAIVDIETLELRTSLPVAGKISLDDSGVIQLSEQFGPNPKRLFGLQLLADGDGDGMPDDWEADYGLDNANANDAVTDLDNDGLSNLDEFLTNTQPNNADSDGDGMPDGWEVDFNLNPSSAADGGEDRDSDGLDNRSEYSLGTSPNDADSDQDGMPDGWEADNGLNPLADDADADPDGDGVSNVNEYNAGTDPNLAPAPPPAPPPSPPPPTSGGSDGGGGGSISEFLLAMLILVYMQRLRRQRM